MVRKLTLLALLAACDSDAPPCPSPPVEVDPAGLRSGWVVDQVHLPVNANEAQELGLDLDCDPQGYPDNAMGQVVSIIAGYETTDLNATLAEMIADGRLLHLLSIQATSLDSAEGVGVELLHGLDEDGDPSDNFLGDETFAVDTARGRGDLAGRIVEGELIARGGQLPVGVTMPGLEEVVVLPVEAGRVEATITGDRIEGRIGGGIPAAAIDTVLLPFIHLGLERAIQRDCAGTTTGAPPCNCAADSFGETLLGVFDEWPDRPGTESDGDCVLEVYELRENALTQGLLSPDVDLFDADGDFNPRADGVEDSLSLGIGFTAVPARIP